MGHTTHVRDRPQELHLVVLQVQLLQVQTSQRTQVRHPVAAQVQELQASPRLQGRHVLDEVPTEAELGGRVEVRELRKVRDFVMGDLKHLQAAELGEARC